MVQVYIKHTDNNFYLLDIEPNEAINFKLTVKDLNDITKIFSPFTQPFKIPATDKNKILCGFIGNEKTLKANSAGEFEAKIYISGFLFQVGKLSFEESQYEFQDQKEFSTTFAGTVTGLVNTIGNATIQDCFKNTDGSFDPLLNIVWDTITLKNSLQKITNLTLSNGLSFSWGIPFISNIRTWLYDDNLTVTDNIAYNQIRKDTIENFIKLSEVRPAVTYQTILNQIIKKYNLNVICPILERPEITELFAFCNSESLVIPYAKYTTLTDLSTIIYTNEENRNDSGGVGLPGRPTHLITLNRGTWIFKIKTQTTDNPEYFKDYIDINLKFVGLVSKDGNPTKIKINLKRNDGLILNSQEIENDSFNFQLKTSQLDSNGELYFSYEILPTTLVDWTSIEVNQKQYFRHEYRFATIKSVERRTYVSTSLCFVLATSLGAGKINLITTLPKIKAIDFLKSFFKTFNISIISTGLSDNSMYWLTPSDIKEVNKPFSKRIVDYTRFTDIATLSKKKASQYNQYSFSHFDSKYYEAVYGDGTKFGSLNYPLIAPAKPTKFEVKTDYSILKQSTTFKQNAVNTCLAFSKDTPTVQDNGGNRYKPVYEEFTLFYLKFKSLGFDTIASEGNIYSNYEINGVLEANFANYTNGKSLAFGAENEITDSLYLNYYDDFIELILNPNAYQSSFNLNLPANEIFLNFSNTTQGESEIPTGFRPQNEIIIGEQRYSLVDSSIDLTTGKTKLTLINI